MLVAFDTATPVASVALGAPGEVPWARRFLRRQRGHAEALVPAIRDLLDEVGASRGEIDGVVAGAGPGSFTGLRVGAATAKGLVRALEVPLYSISSLAAGAVTAGLETGELGGPTLHGTEAERPRHVLFDARGDRIYAATYRIREGRLETLTSPRADRLEPFLAAGPDPRGIACGSGARRHRERLEAAGLEVAPEPAGAPTAEGLLRILGLSPDVAPVEAPARWEPEYLREWTPG